MGVFCVRAHELKAQEYADRDAEAQRNPASDRSTAPGAQSRRMQLQLVSVL